MLACPTDGPAPLVDALGAKTPGLLANGCLASGSEKRNAVIFRDPPNGGGRQSPCPPNGGGRQSLRRWPTIARLLPPQHAEGHR